jgi:hypothetical protein
MEQAKPPSLLMLPINIVLTVMILQLAIPLPLLTPAVSAFAILTMLALDAMSANQVITVQTASHVTRDVQMESAKMVSLVPVFASAMQAGKGTFVTKPLVLFAIHVLLALSVILSQEMV